MNTEFVIAKIVGLFRDSLCENDFGLDSTGYLTSCTVNTYLLALPQIIIFFYIVSQAKGLMQTTPQHTRLKQIKMLLTAAHVVVVVQHGQYVLNAISLSVGMLMLLVVFVLSYMDLNGVEVPGQALEAYYHIYTAATGYFALSLVAHSASPERNLRLHAAAWMCTVSLLNSAMRNIANATESHSIPSL